MRSTRREYRMLLGAVKVRRKKHVLYSRLAKSDETKVNKMRSDYSLLLSGLYAIILILVGFLLPVSEALQDNWLEEEYITAFLMYIYCVSTAFLVYVEIYLLLTKKQHQHHHHDGNHDSKGHHGVEGHSPSGHAITYSHPDFSESPPTNRHSNTNNTHAITAPKSPDALEKDSQKAAKKSLAKHRSVTALVRYSSSVNLNAKEKDLNGNHAPASRMSDFPQEHFGEVVDEEVEMWIDMTKLGGIFSHEGSSFYLRIGSLFFGIGHLVYICLEIENSSYAQPGCAINTYWWTYIVRLVFIVVQTFFLFKNHAVHIQKWKVLARFGFAHLIASNFCLWLRTLVNEIVHEYHHLSDGHHSDPNSTAPDAHSGGGGASTPAAGHGQGPLHSIVKRASAEGGCQQYRGILQASSVYLFPFVLEYSLIAMGTFAIIYHSIDEEKKDDMVRGLANFFKVQAIDMSGVEKAAAHHGGDGGHHDAPILQKSHRGVFASMILLIGCVISIILFFFASDSEHNPAKAELIYLCTDIVLHSILLIVCVAAVLRIHSLSYIAKPVSVDDWLLYLSMCGTLVLEIAVTIASGHSVSYAAQPSSREVLRLCCSIIAAVQTVAQIIVILSGMRRYPSKASHVTDMPGRGLVAFLVIGNVTVWIFRTMQAKELTLQTTQSDFFGGLAWVLILNINLPLLLFYRFHSSVCLADVWAIAYSPLHHHVSKSPDHGQHGGESATPGSPESPCDPRTNTIIRSVSVPQLCRQTSSFMRKGGPHDNAVFELEEDVSPSGSVPSLVSAHRL